MPYGLLTKKKIIISSEPSLKAGVLSFKHTEIFRVAQSKSLQRGDRSTQVAAPLDGEGKNYTALAYSFFECCMGFLNGLGVWRTLKSSRQNKTTQCRYFTAGFRGMGEDAFGLQSLHALLLSFFFLTRLLAKPNSLCSSV